MTKQIITTITTALAIAALIAIGTILVLSKINGPSPAQDDSSIKKNVPQKGEEVPTPDIFKEYVSEEENIKAQALDSEASSLIESDPEAAYEKYKQAAKAYKDAGNISKSSEMDANAMTAKILIEQQSKEQN